MRAMVLTRRTLALAAIGVALVGLSVIAYSRHTNGDEPQLRTVGPSGEMESDDLAGISLANVVASNEYAWVSGLHPSDPGTQLLWRLDAEGSATMIGEVPDGAWLLGPGPDGGFTLGQFRCTLGDGLDGESAEARCDGSMVGEVVVASSDGEEQSRVELWEDEDGDVGSGTSIELVGASSESVWVISKGSVWEVGYDGELGHNLPRDGLVCIVNGEPYALRAVRESEMRLDETDGADTNPSTEDPDSASKLPEYPINGSDLRPDDGDEVTFDIYGFTASEFAPSGQSDTRTVETSSSTAVGRCANDGIAVVDLGDNRPVAVWTPNNGWVDISTDDSPAAASGDILIEAPSALFVVAQDGAVSDLHGDGAVVSTGLNISSVAGDEVAASTNDSGEPVPGSMQFELLIDGSESVTVACIATVYNDNADAAPCVVERR